MLNAMSMISHFNEISEIQMVMLFLHFSQDVQEANMFTKFSSLVIENRLINGGTVIDGRLATYWDDVRAILTND